MRFFHISDLHIGKQLHERSLLEDQRHILSQVAARTREYRPDAVIIAGDIYDKSMPSAEAVTVFDDFITELAATDTTVLLISGNHDSAERINFGSRIFAKNNVHFAGIPPRTPSGHIKRVVLKDSFGDVNFWLLPFVKPGYVRGIFESADLSNTDLGNTDLKNSDSDNADLKNPVRSYDSAVRAVLERENIDYSERNVIISHQLYTNGSVSPVRSDSEVISIGGIDNIDAGALEKFDYAALGHIHSAQQVKSPNIRYCGTLLKYSVSEENDEKGLLMVELGAKGKAADFCVIPLSPLRDVRQIKGKFDDITKRFAGEHKDEVCNDYVSVVLTDENEIFNAGSRLADIFPKLLTIRVQNSRTKMTVSDISYADTALTPSEEFEAFFEQMQGRSMTENERKAFSEVLKEVDE